MHYQVAKESRFAYEVETNSERLVTYAMQKRIGYWQCHMLTDTWSVEEPKGGGFRRFRKFRTARAKRGQLMIMTHIN